MHTCIIEHMCASILVEYIQVLLPERYKHKYIRG